MLRSRRAFFRVHHSQVDEAQAREDLASWTKEDHELYDILGDGTSVGFVHLNWRGATVCWIEDIFVEESLRRQGIASKAIGLVEEVLQKRGVEGIQPNAEGRLVAWTFASSNLMIELCIVSINSSWTGKAVLI